MPHTNDIQSLIQAIDAHRSEMAAQAGSLQQMTYDIRRLTDETERVARELKRLVDWNISRTYSN